MIAPMKIAASASLAAWTWDCAPHATPPTADRAGMLQGNWVTACLPIGQEGRHGHIVQVTVAGDTIQATSQIYAKSTCDSPTFRVKYMGRLHAAQERSDRIDFEYEVVAIAITLENAAVVAQYNQSTGCGLSGWVKDVPMPVAGRRCAPYAFAATGDRLFDSTWIARSGLRFGAFPDVWANTAPSRRPSEPVPSPGDEPIALG